MEKFNTKQNSQEQGKEFIRSLEVEGRGYKELLNYFMLKEYPYSYEKEDNKIKELKVLAEKALEELSKLLEQPITPELLLKQLKFQPAEGLVNTLQNDGSIKTLDEYRLPVVLIQGEKFADVLGEAKKNAQAVAYRGEGKIPFVIVRSSKKDEVYNQNKLEENIPHETHHVLWGKLKDDKMFEIEETFEYEKEHFEMYRDEVMATVSGGARPHGYNIFNLNGNESQKVKEFREEHEDIYQKVQDYTIETNEKLRELSPRVKDAGIGYELFIGIALRAKNFKEFNFFLEKLSKSLPGDVVKKDIEKPDQPKNPLAGWEVLV